MSKYIESRLSRYLRKGVKFKEVGIIYFLNIMNTTNPDVAITNVFVPLNKDKSKCLVWGVGATALLTQKIVIVKNFPIFDKKDLTYDETRTILMSIMRRKKLNRICSKLEI